MPISDWFEKLGRTIFESPFGAMDSAKDAPEIAEIRLALLDEVKAKTDDGIIDRLRHRVTVYTASPRGYRKRVLRPGDAYTSPLLPGLAIPLEGVL